MKTTMLKSFFFLTCLALFAAGCGKDGGKSSGNNNYNWGQNPYGSSQDSQASYASALTWYNSNSEISQTYGPRVEKRRTSVYSGPECKQKTALGFIDYTYCKNTQPQGSDSSRTVNVIVQPVKSQNADLAAVFANQGSLLRATSSISPVNTNGRLYKIELIKSNGKLVQFTIDTGLNSAFNPVEKYDEETGTLNYVTNPYDLR